MTDSNSNTTIASTNAIAPVSPKQRRLDEMDRIRQLLDEGHRSFGVPWVGSKSGIGGELIIADLIDGTIRSCTRSLGSCSSVAMLGLDLGSPREPHFALDDSTMSGLKGFGGDIDLALFVRESVKSPVQRYGDGAFRRLEQDHLILIDSKQYNGDWDLTEQFAKKVKLVRWLRKALSANVMLGAGSQSNMLRISYHFAMTGDYAPSAWLARVGSGISGAEKPTLVDTGMQWWNSPNDLIMQSPAEVIIGQASMLIMNNNRNDFRDAVPRALWHMIKTENQVPYGV